MAINKYFATVIIISLWISVTGTGLIYAHVPFLALDNHPSKERALEIDDIQISKVIYQKISIDSPQSWIQFYGKEGETVYFQLGIPYIDALVNYRPSVALIEPGAEISPEKIVSSPDENVLVFDSKDSVNIDVFHEPFTDTTSWILFEEYVTFTKSGMHFLVSFSPDNQPGKMWVAIGKKEVFGPKDLTRLPSAISEVKSFHESISINGIFSYGSILKVALPLTAVFFTALTVTIWLKRTRKLGAN